MSAYPQLSSTAQAALRRFPSVLYPTHPSEEVISTHFHPNAPKGHTESQFESDLLRYFPGQIHTGLLVPQASGQNPYVPDFAYIEGHLLIDIEVDEPYSYLSREPLHYRGDPNDDRRNAFFQSQGWIVIRFSEAQVVQAPASCCKAIASVIAAHYQDNSRMVPFREVPTLRPQARWTREDAIAMATENARDRYLSTHLSETTQPAAKPENRSSKQARKSRPTVYCPRCGEGPIPWRGHYIACPNCYYDQFTL